MGKRGPAQSPASALRAAGSTLLDSRGKRRDDPRREPKAWNRERPAAIHVSELDGYLGLIPKYDPYRDAGDCTFSPSRACRAVNWIQQRCTHIKGRLGGSAFVLSPLQIGIVANLLGWLRPDGMRRYRRCLVYVPRKWGKTLLGAAILLYLLLEDGEEGSEVYTAASTRNQATLLWLPAKGMIRNDRYLSGRLRAYQHSIARLDPDGLADGSFFQAISAEAPSAHGFSPAAYAIDEVHTQKDGELMDVMDTGTASREQPVELNFTTADYEGESPCNELYAYAKQVRDGLTEGFDGQGDPEFLPVVIEIEDGDDWRDEKVWAKANPHYPITPTESYMRSRIRRAMASPRYLNVVLRLNFNKRTQADVQWFDIDVWDRCAGTVDPGALKGRPCYGGLDLSTKSDLTAFVLVFPDDGHAVLPFFWAPEKTATRREEKNLRPSYRAWEQQGHMTLCRGPTIDQEMIRQKVRELGETYQILGVGMDRWQADKVAKELEEVDGVCEFHPVGMGYASMSGPCKYLEQLVLDGELQHGAHPILRWNASTVMAETDNSPAENIKPVKPKTKTKARRQDDNKIDGIVALAMALAVYIESDMDGGDSVYETRGIRTL